MHKTLYNISSKAGNSSGSERARTKELRPYLYLNLSSECFCSEKAGWSVSNGQDKTFRYRTGPDVFYKSVFTAFALIQISCNYKIAKTKSNIKDKLCRLPDGVLFTSSTVVTLLLIAFISPIFSPPATRSHQRKQWYYFAAMIKLCSPIFDFSLPKIAKSTLSLIFSRMDFLIRNFPSSVFHPQFIIRIFPSVIRHPPPSGPRFTETPDFPPNP